METVLTLNLKKAKELYPTADPALKALLEQNFGKKKLSKNILDVIDGLDAVYAYHNIDRFKFEMNMKDLSKDTQAYEVLKLIVAAYNEGNPPEYTNGDVKKWYPVFRTVSGFGFSYGTYFYSYSYTHVGSRLAFREEAHAEAAGRLFEKVYEAYYMP